MFYQNNNNKNSNNNKMNSSFMLSLFGSALLKAGLICILLTSLSACQLTAKPEPLASTHKTLHYSHYYLWLKTLSDQELLTEINIQKQALAAQEMSFTEPSNSTKQHFTQHHAKMMLIYSLPSSPIYQPYAAKTLLNNADFSDDKYLSPNESNDSLHNLAFMLLLKDQLNAQLKLLTAQAASKTKTQQEYAKKDDVIKQLEQQLQQLKKIEENLTKHQ